jgi:hypothetical protein
VLSLVSRSCAEGSSPDRIAGLYTDLLSALCSLVSHLPESEGEQVQIFLLEQCFSMYFYVRRFAQDVLAFVAGHLDTEAVLALLGLLVDLFGRLPLDSLEFEYAGTTLSLALHSVGEDVVGLFQQKYELESPKPSDQTAILWSVLQSETTVPDAVLPRHCALLLSWSLQQLVVESVATVVPEMIMAVRSIVAMYRIVCACCSWL